MTTTERYIDLHTHSYCSDGTFSPEGLVILAKRMGLDAIALTDHDTLDGLTQFHNAGIQYHIETISGIELACRYEKFHQPELHIVGLGFCENAASLTAYMEEIQNNRVARNLEMVQRFNALGMPMTMDEVSRESGGEIITRAHFARLLLKKGYIKNRDEAFENYIGDGKPAFIPRLLPTPQRCIEMIHNAGGVAILAHPTLYHLAYDQLDCVCAELSALGLDGMECLYATYTSAQRKQIQGLADKYHLLPSGGSDFHGENKPTIQLGIGTGNLQIPYSFWSDLRAKTK